MSKKVVQFQNGIFSEKTSQRKGSIPEWNSQSCFLKVNWFNSLIGAETTIVQGQLLTPVTLRKHRKGKEGGAGGAY